MPGRIGRSDFLSQLAHKFGVEERAEWTNNNSTYTQNAYVIDLPEMFPEEKISKLVSKIFKYNKISGESSIVVVPVAGWDTSKIPQVISPNKRLVDEYAQSFSLFAQNSAENADIILRFSKTSQRMEIFQDRDQNYFTFTAGVRITDADEFLFKHGLALPPNMPTLHVASLVGAAANGCYGPARDLGPMTTNIVKMIVITPDGTLMTLSQKKNAELFKVFRDGHMGAAFIVTEMTIKVEPAFFMKQHHIQYQNAESLKEAMAISNPLEKEHFITSFFPVEMNHTRPHVPRFRLTTFERTQESPQEKIPTSKEQDFHDWINLMKTETGEPLIASITKHPNLHQFLPFILKLAAIETYGKTKETFKIDYSHRIAHILRTYTDLPIAVINWLIPVENAEQARDLLIQIFEITETYLKEKAKVHEYPLLNAFSRFLKGVADPYSEGGITPTVTDYPRQSILSFEFVTYFPLDKSPAFQELVNLIADHLTSNNLKFHYHPGKTHPEKIRTLKQIYKDPKDQKRLDNFRKAINFLHGGENNIQFSPFLTPGKKEYLGYTTPEIKKEANRVVKENPADQSLDNSQKNALNKIIELAQEGDSAKWIRRATRLLPDE